MTDERKEFEAWYLKNTVSEVTHLGLAESAWQAGRAPLLARIRELEAQLSITPPRKSE